MWCITVRQWFIISQSYAMYPSMHTVMETIMVTAITAATVIMGIVGMKEVTKTAATTAVIIAANLRHLLDIRL